MVHWFELQTTFVWKFNPSLIGENPLASNYKNKREHVLITWKIFLSQMTSSSLVLLVLVVVAALGQRGRKPPSALEQREPPQPPKEAINDAEFCSKSRVGRIF